MLAYGLQVWCSAMYITIVLGTKSLYIDYYYFFLLSPLFFCVSTELKSQMFLESGIYPGNSKCCHKFTSPKNTSDFHLIAAPPKKHSMIDVLNI